MSAKPPRKESDPLLQFDFSDLAAPEEAPASSPRGDPLELEPEPAPYELEPPAAKGKATGDDFWGIASKIKPSVAPEARLPGTPSLHRRKPSLDSVEIEEGMPPAFSPPIPEPHKVHDPLPDEEEAEDAPPDDEPRPDFASGKSWNDFLIPAVDFTVPTLPPFVIGVAGMAWLSGQWPNAIQPLAQPMVALSLWCLLTVSNYVYYTFCIGLIGESYGRLALDPPAELFPRPDWPWIWKRMLPNLGLSLAMVGLLHWLA